MSGGGSRYGRSRNGEYCACVKLVRFSSMTALRVAGVAWPFYFVLVYAIALILTPIK